MGARYGCRLRTRYGSPGPTATLGEITRSWKTHWVERWITFAQAARQLRGVMGDNVGVARGLNRSGAMALREALQLSAEQSWESLMDGANRCVSTDGLGPRLKDVGAMGDDQTD